MPAFDAHHHLLKGNSYLNQGQYNNAITSYKEFLKTAPDHVVAHNNLGVAYHKLGNIPEAVLSYQNAIKRKANYYDAVYNLAILLKNEHALPEACYYFNQAIEINNKNVNSIIGLAQTLSLLGEFEKSILAYLQAIQLSPHNASLITEAAKLEMQLKHYKQAEILFKRVVHIEFYDPFAWQNLGLVLKMQGKLEEALNSLGHAISLNPHISSVHYAIGVIYYEKGNLPCAMEHIEKAFMLDPSHKEDYGLLPILKSTQKYLN